MWKVDDWYYFGLPGVVSLNLLRGEEHQKKFDRLGVGVYVSDFLLWMFGTIAVVGCPGEKKSEGWVTDSRDSEDLKGIGETMDTHYLKNKVHKTKVEE